MIVKLLTEHHFEFLSFKGGCPGSSESTHVKMPHCWKSHALAQMHLHKLTFVLLNLDISRFWKQLIIKLLSSADNIHEQFGVISGPTVCLVLIWIHTI